MQFVRIFFLIFVFLKFSNPSFGQFISAYIGVNGLTCSLCSRSVEMSVRKLDFVESVEMDLNLTSGKIVFRKDAKVMIDKIAKAITDAGFSVRSLSADFNFNDLNIDKNFCWTFEHYKYQFLKSESKNLNGLICIKFVGKKFLPKKEFKEWSAILTNEKVCKAKNVYYITLCD